MHAVRGKRGGGGGKKADHQRSVSDSDFIVCKKVRWRPSNVLVDPSTFLLTQSLSWRNFHPISWLLFLFGMIWFCERKHFLKWAADALSIFWIIAFIKEDTLDQKKMLTIRRRDHTFITNSAKRGGEQMILPQLLLWKTNTGKEKLMWDIMKHFKVKFQSWIVIWNLKQRNLIYQHCMIWKTD